jgi:hypothetical protein
LDHCKGAPQELLVKGLLVGSIRGHWVFELLIGRGHAFVLHQFQQRSYPTRLEESTKIDCICGGNPRRKEENTMPSETALTKEHLVSQLVKQIGLKQDDAVKAVDNIVSELVFAKAGRLLADQNCQCCGGGAARE